ncbi:MAG: hypothetical protein EP338_14530 [Bacteroidetes bacterium]|nr:MAG: hypothetical protein EP338_14530 [Bacteroidota bacterium]
MDKYLQQILLEVNTIILPGLGALTVTSQKSGEIMFMDFLKHDDGLLSKYISEKEGIEENEAKNMISKYVRDIQAKLDAGESYDMYQFGRFVKKDGEISFQNWKDYQSADQTATPPPAEPKAAPIVDMKPTPTPEEVKTEEKKTTPPPPPKEEKKPEEKPAASTAQKETPAAPKEAPSKEDNKAVQDKVDAVAPDQNVYVPEEEVKNIKKEAEKSAPAPEKEKVASKAAEVEKKAKMPKDKASQKPQKEKKEKKKRGALFWVLIFLGVIVILGGTGTAIFYDQVKEFFEGKHTEQVAHNDQDATEGEQSDSESTPDEDSGEAENTSDMENDMDTGEQTPDESSMEQETEQQSEPETIETPPPAPSGNVSGSFHIIVGGFSMEENANKLAQKLQGEGKSARVLGKFDELYLVAYDSFDSMEDAKTALQTASMPGWIFKYPK